MIQSINFPISTYSIAPYGSWEKLGEQQQAWLMEAAQYASQTGRDAVSRIEEETFKKLTEIGVTIVEVPDKTAWVEACQPTIKAYSSKLPDLYQQILDLQ